MFPERWKKSAEPRSRKSRANSELFFKLGLALSLQWLCKMPSSELTYFGLKVLIAECVSLEARKKNLLQQETEQSKFRVLFWFRFEIIATMIPQNTINIWIEGFDSWTCSFGKPEKKSVEPRSRQQSTRRAFSELSFELDSILSLQWFCKIPFYISPT